MATKIYSGFALAFAEEEDPHRAATLYLKARDHGLAVLPQGQIIRSGTYAAAEQAIVSIKKKQIELLFWTGQAWAGAIRLGLDDPRNLAALARVEVMMKRVMEMDPEYYHGGPLLFVGVLTGAKPPPAGGDVDMGLQYMQEAFRVSREHFLLAQYFRADLLSLIPGRETDAREMLLSLLDDDSSHPEELTLINTVAKSRAARLLATIREEEL